MLYAGSVSYYAALFHAKHVAFDIHERYVKQTLRNRMYILSANGVQALSIPVIKPNGSKSLSSEILIDDSSSWRMQHLKSLQTAYASSPYFEHYESEVKAILLNTELKNLMEFNLHFHSIISLWLDLDLENFCLNNYTYSTESELFKSTFSERNVLYRGERYIQVFTQKDTFESDLSILDAIFNLGPMARNLLK